MAEKVGALLLAAGFSRRFGGTKLLAQLENGVTVFEQTRTRLLAAVADYAVITRPESVDGLKAFELRLNVFDGAGGGMGASLAFGISIARQQGWDACLICLADMPFIETATYRKLVTAADADHIVVPCFEDKPGNPVVFGSRFYGDLVRLSEDTGGRPVLRQYPAQVVRLPMTDSAILDDIDTPEELRALQIRYS